MKTLLEMQRQITLIKLAMKERKRHIHRILVSQHKAWFRLLDILFAAIIMFSFGAAALTNVMVSKEAADTGKTMILQEANPITAEVTGLEKHPDTKGFINLYLYMVFYWIMMLGMFVYYRNTIITYDGLLLFTFVAILLFCIVGIDFFNNYGYFIGKVLFKV